EQTPPCNRLRRRGRFSLSGCTPMTRPPQEISPARLPAEDALEAIAAPGVSAGQSFAQACISRIDLSETRAADMRFEEALLSNVALRKTAWQGLRMVDVRLEGCDLSNADW